MAGVYLAHDRKYDRLVALKLLQSSWRTPSVPTASSARYALPPGCSTTTS